MKVIILAGSIAEAEEHARNAGLDFKDVIMPQSERPLQGMRVRDEDLIVELPTFAQHPLRERIRQSLRVSISMCKSDAVWHVIGS